MISVKENGTSLKAINEIISLDLQSKIIRTMQDINRLKILLAEKKRTNKWLCEQLGVNPTTVSKWCTNSSQPSIEMVFRMMEILDVNIEQIINLPKKRPA